MDFWDLTKVLVRRWHIAVPGLVLTLGAAAAILATGDPRYIATSFVQVAPPQSRPAQAGEPSLEQRNPWMGMGAGTLANTAMLTLSQPSVAESMRAAGFAATHTATLDDYSPLVTFEVTGESRQSALATTDELIRRFDASVRDLQVSVYGVAEQDLATTKRIDAGNNITESNANIIRAVVAVGGVGLLFTFGLAIGVDALVTRRARRRSGAGPGVGVEDLSPQPVGPVPNGQSSRESARARTASVLVGVRQVAIEPGMVPEPEPVLDRGPAGGGRADDAFDVMGGHSAGGSGLTAGSESDATVGPDATVVLPLAYRTPRRTGR